MNITATKKRRLKYTQSEKKHICLNSSSLKFVVFFSSLLERLFFSFDFRE